MDGQILRIVRATTGRARTDTDGPDKTPGGGAAVIVREAEGGADPMTETGGGTRVDAAVRSQHEDAMDNSPGSQQSIIAESSGVGHGQSPVNAPHMSRASRP